MDRRITLKTLEKDLKFFKKMFNIVRLVDPVNKRVLEYGESTVGYTDEVCFNYWNNNRICDNCISVRANINQKAFTKLEQDGKTIMMVTAIPIETEDKAVVLELLNNVTDSIMIGQGDYNEGKFMHHVITDLNELLVKDSLTDIYNRRFIDERLPIEITAAVVKDVPLTVAMMDIDNLREINDRFGHIVGDKVLKEIGSILRLVVPSENGWVARYGGDEFLICVNDEGQLDTRALAERLRRKIQQIKVPVIEEGVEVTVSIGMHTMTGESGKVTAEDIIHIADGKLYRAKRDGKNRIICKN